MTKILWAVEAKRKGKWVILPNLIFVARENAQWELECLFRDDDEEYRLVSYARRDSTE